MEKETEKALRGLNILMSSAWAYYAGAAMQFTEVSLTFLAISILCGYMAFAPAKPCTPTDCRDA